MKKIIIVLCLIVFVAGIAAYQNYSNRRLFQAIDGWQSEIEAAKLDGETPNEVSTFLAKHHATQQPYTGTQTVYNDSTHTQQNQGYILAETPAVAYIFGLPEGHSWSIKMCFTFDAHNKCRNSYVYGQGS